MTTQQEALELARGVEQLVGERFDSRALHEFVDSGNLRDDELMAMASEIGCFELALPEAQGGLGLDPASLVPTYQVLGAYMAPLPVISCALAGDLLARAESGQWLARLGEGAKFAICLPPWSELWLEGGDGGSRLYGALPFILDGADADVLLVRAQLEPEAVWMAIGTKAASVVCTPVPLVDETRNSAGVDFAGVTIPPASVIAQGDMARLLDNVLAAHAALALAADSLGGAKAMLGKTIDYLKVREQFGRPIGSFQALKHRAANLHLKATVAQALLDEAVDAARARDGSAAMLAHLAFAQAADAYAAIAEDCLQLHGGIGFTRDHDAHLHLKRAKLNQALLGGADAARDEAARLVTR
ncbi:MAG: acyl-CoA dehydrogenase [Alphaproteobacteria bacterium]|nr:acyl-CoA dehydrogenase [Alphaproteobacteria bacterium]